MVIFVSSSTETAFVFAIVSPIPAV
jgi:hypothetical protein